MSVEHNESFEQITPPAVVLFDAMIEAGKHSLAAGNMSDQQTYFDDALNLAIGVRVSPEIQQREVKERLQMMAMPYRFGEPTPLDPIGLQVVGKLFRIADSIIAQKEAVTLQKK